MSEKIRKYLSDIGKRGGRKSRRTLDPETARNMVRLREAKRAFRRFYASCFWSCDPNCVLTLDDVEWVAKQQQSKVCVLWMLMLKTIWFLSVALFLVHPMVI